jgi:hypothetical protein
VDFSAFWPDPSDPVNSQANDTKPIEGLENMLKVEVAAVSGVVSYYSYCSRCIVISLILYRNA